MRLNVRAQFLLPTLALVILGMGCSSFVSYLRATQAIRDIVSNEISTQAESTRDILELWIGQRLKDMHFLSMQESVAKALEESLFVLQNRESVNAMLAETAEQVGAYEGLRVALPNGDVVCSSTDDALQQHLNVADREYFRRAMQGEMVLSDPLSSSVSGHAIFIIAVPITVHDEVRGVVFGSVNMDVLSTRFIDPITLGHGGHAFIISEQGLVIAHPDREHVLNLDLGDQPYVRQMIEQGRGIVEYASEGDDRIMGFASLDTTQWTVAVTADLDVVLAPARQMGQVNLLISLVVVLVMCLLISLVAHRIVRPIKGAIQVMDKLSLGLLGTRLNSRRTDEIGRLSRSIDSFSDKLQHIAAVQARIGQGDLAVDIPMQSANDEVAGAVRAMAGSMCELVGAARNTADSVAVGAGQVMETSQSLSAGATEQAASLEQISSTIAQMGPQTRTSADNAAQASLLAQEARATAEKGSENMLDMVRAMSEIRESSESIAKILRVIDEIAFQTNLLALNAAVEAARAGHHGKGFAVVAEEVRSLAGRSATAARETEQLIQDSARRVEQGNMIAERTSQALEEIVTSSDRTAQLVEEIAHAGQELAEGIAQVNQGLSQVDQITQANTTSAEQTASAAAALARQASELNALMRRFRLEHHGQETASRPMDVDIYTDSAPSRSTATRTPTLPGTPAELQKLSE